MSTNMAGNAAAWWSAVSGRGRYVHAVVVGARRSGKTSWFARLAQDQPERVVHWDVRRVARLRSTDDVWSDLFRALAVKAGGSGDPLEDLEDHLDMLEAGPELVVDDWDAAIDARGVSVPDACYEVLDQLTRFCLGQVTTRSRGACLGLVLLTSLPDVTDLEYFTRAAQRATFERLSKLVTRSFAAERFPMLGLPEAVDLLVGAGVPVADAGMVAEACGGWPWLLLEAAAATVAHGGWTPDVAREVCDGRLPGLMEASLVPCLQARPEVRLRGVRPLDYVAQELARGRAPEAFGLPAAFSDPATVAPLIGRLLTRTFLVVDTENVRMPFQRLAEVEPARYPDGVEAYLQRHVGAWVARLQADFAVADEDVWLVGRSAERIDATVGAGSPGERLFLSDELREKAARTGGDGSDDNLMTAQVARRAERNPMARFVLASGDADAPLILELVGALDQVVVCTPWRASGKLRDRLPRGDRLREHTFPVSRPRNVSAEEINEARRRRRNRPDGGQAAP